jgi:hypothetical protein
LLRCNLWRPGLACDEGRLAHFPIAHTFNFKELGHHRVGAFHCGRIGDSSVGRAVKTAPFPAKTLAACNACSASLSSQLCNQSTSPPVHSGRVFLLHALRDLTPQLPRAS